jgi:hypothetical protein
MHPKPYMRVLAVVVGVGAVVAGGSRSARGEDPDLAAKRERCAIRLSIALTGDGPSAALLAAQDPQAQVDTLLGTPEFIERYASFINRSFNRLPGPTPARDAPYFLVRKILETKGQWKDVFLGPYNVVENMDGSASVADDASGLGYFRSDAWMRKYAGNEGAGIKLQTASRMVDNTVGLKVQAVQAAPDQDRSAAGRQSGACRGCHFDSWFALDKIASVLSRRVGTGNDITFGPPPSSPQQVLDGVTVKDDKDVVTALVSSVQYLFHQCRLAFTFLYGRSENSCEGAVLDKCMDTLKTTGLLQAGLSVIAKDPAFCD